MQAKTLPKRVGKIIGIEILKDSQLFEEEGVEALEFTKSQA